MTIDHLLRSLKEQRDQIDAAIAAIESFANGKGATAGAIRASVKHMKWTEERKKNFVPWNKGMHASYKQKRRKVQVKWSPERRAKFMATMKRKQAGKE